jgi:hypothetical protein
VASSYRGLQQLRLQATAALSHGGFLRHRFDSPFSAPEDEHPDRLSGAGLTTLAFVLVFFAPGLRDINFYRGIRKGLSFGSPSGVRPFDENHLAAGPSKANVTESQMLPVTGCP